MTQSLPTARSFSHLILLPIALVIALAACARLPPHYSNSVPIETPSDRDRSAAVNINHASAVELDSLPGIGPVLAERIVNHRKEYGGFRRVEHLLMVRGISERKFRAIRSRIRVE